MKITKIIASMTTLLWISGVDLAAQEKEFIGVGARVRVTAPAISISKTVGTLVAWNVDTLLLQAENPAFSNPLAIPLASITRFEVNRGKGSRKESALKGAVIGFFVIGVSAAVVLEANAGTFDLSHGDLLKASLISGAGGLVLGGLLGSRLPGEQRWEFIQVNRIRLKMMPND